MDNTVAKTQVQIEMTQLFEVSDVLKQEDGPALLLLNLVKEYVMRKVTVDSNTTLQYKLKQIAGYAGDICIMGRRREAMKQKYEELKRAAIGRLIFNANKTKIMIRNIQARYTY